ncbi:MAG: glycosyltransferase family 2 protein [Flavobacteriales bacterium]|nr:glycosyltransferase family 2 protein [Flavobacteriales bacterium]
MLLSAVICTHNPRRDHLSRTLDGLRAQTLERTAWELLLVDNHSTTPLAGTWDLSWHANARHVREDELGLTPARLRGITEAASDLVLFIDDDNVLAPDYLERVVAYAEGHPLVGCFGAGIIDPEFEEQPASELAPYLDMLALRNETRVQWSNLPGDGVVPWGAGMVVRRNVAEEYARRMKAFAGRGSLDRKGDQLNSGGDDEFSHVACDLGMGKALFPDLRITHLIGKGRTRKEYLLRLREGIAFSNAMLRHMHGGTVKRPDRPYRLTPMDLIGQALRGRFYLFFKNGSRYLQQRSKGPLHQEFAEAWSKGVDRFLDQHDRR